MKSQADLLEEQIARLVEKHGPRAPLLSFLRDQANYLRRAERVRAGLEEPWENPVVTRGGSTRGRL